MRWFKRKLVNWLLKDVEIGEIIVGKLKIGGKTVTIDANSILLPSLTTDPTLAEGKIWYRADLDRLQYAIDTATKREIPYGTINVDAHASRHVAEGIDAIPAGGISRAQLEAPTVDVHLQYLYIVGGDAQVGTVGYGGNYTIATKTSYADKAVEVSLTMSNNGMVYGRVSTPGGNTLYLTGHYPPLATKDHMLSKIVAGTITDLAIEAVDLNGWACYIYKLSCSGSTLKSFRDDMTTPKLSVTDTSIGSGVFGHLIARGDVYGVEFFGLLRAPASPSSPPAVIMEVAVEGSGKFDEPFRPLMSKNLVEVTSLIGLSDFLYQEARKYSILKARDFTDEEIKLLLGYVPQHQIDLDAVTFGSFELHPDKAPTAIVMITGDNPYKAGAIDRQKGKAKRVFAPPKDYGEAISLYNMLRKDYPHWLAGKDNFAYQTLGLEVFDWFQNVDFYYGEFIEHKTHYSQLKNVPDFEIRNRLNELMEELSKVSVLIDERDKHVTKAKEILSEGW
jgi:hypothetical protein